MSVFGCDDDKDEPVHLPLNKWYAAGVAVACVMVLAFVAVAITAPFYQEWSRGDAVNGGWNWPLIIGLNGLCALGAAAVVWKLYADARTTIDGSGVSRPSLFGTTHIAWPDVTAVKTFGTQGIHIHAGRVRIVISPHAYHDPAALVTMIDHLSRAPREGRENPLGTEADPDAGSTGGSDDSP